MLPNDAPRPSPTSHDPSLLAALDRLVERIPPSMPSEDGCIRVPPTGGEREDLLRAVRGVEATIQNSPPWPLLQAITERIRPLVEQLRAEPAEIVVDTEFGHRLRGLVWAAHDCVRTRRTRWDVPREGADLLAALAKRPPVDRASAVRSLWVAADPKYLEPEWHLREAIRAARGADDPSVWHFLEEHEPRQVKAAVNRVASALVMGRKHLPMTSAELADAVAEALSHPDTTEDMALLCLLRDEIAGCVAANFPADHTRWPLLRGASFDVGQIDDVWRVVVMSHRDTRGDVGGGWRRSQGPEALRPPDALFAGESAVHEARELIDEWFLASRSALGLGQRDALFVCPVRTDDPHGDSIRGAWTVSDRTGIDVLSKLNVDIHAEALGIALSRARLDAPGPDATRMRVAEHVEDFVRATARWLEFHKMAQMKQDTLASVPPNVERPDLVEGLLTLQHDQYGAASEIRRLGPELARDLERLGVDAKSVLSIAHCAGPSGGGPAYVWPRWEEMKVSLQQVAIRLRVHEDAPPPAASPSSDEAVATSVPVAAPPPPVVLSPMSLGELTELLAGAGEVPDSKPSQLAGAVPVLTTDAVRARIKRAKGGTHYMAIKECERHDGFDRATALDIIRRIAAQHAADVEAAHAAREEIDRLRRAEKIGVAPRPTDADNPRRVPTTPL